MIKLLVCTVLSFVGSAAVATTPVIVESNSVSIQTEVNYIVLKVEAQCRPPKFEDDSFSVFFAADSYVAMNKYVGKGYSYKLIGRTCGGQGIAELPSDSFASVDVLVYNATQARSAVETAISDLLKAH